MIQILGSKIYYNGWYILKWCCVISSIESIINHLCSSLSGELSLDIRRSHVLKDAMKESKKKKFDPLKSLSVCCPFY